MRVQTGGEDGFAFFTARHSYGHYDGFSAGGGTVIHRGVGDFHPGKKRDLGLELKQGLQRALGNFGLVRCVSGQEF